MADGPSSRPNVVLILTDDQGYGDLACHGNPVALTPHLDRLHDESLRFTDFHAAPMCTATRGQLLTGLDAARNGALNVSSGRTLLRRELPTLADVFRANGYRTGLFGKWHLGDNYPYRPQDRGFDETLWFPSSHLSSLPDYWQNDYFDDVYCRNGERQRYQGYCTEVFFAEAKRWVTQVQRAGDPFLLYLPTNAPHAPLYVPAADREAVEAHFAAHEHRLPALKPAMKASIIRFLAMIRNLDAQVGELRAFLDAADLARDTLLIFMTDNGSTFGHVYYNAGLRGSKCSLWEGGHRVPCFVHWPNGGLTAPRDIPGLAQMQDLLPTLVDLLGLDAAPAECDGISLAPALRGEADPPSDRKLVINYSRMPGELDYPTPDSPSLVRREGAAVLWQRYRLLEGRVLSDLANDPAQQTDFASQYPEVVDTMRAHLDGWWAAVGPRANEIQRIIVGSDAENPMVLSACDWMDVFVDQQQQVRQGVRRNSYWHLDVAQAGRYELRLRRWPRESGLALSAACPPATLADGELPGGQALPIARARVLLAGQTHVQELGPEAEEAVFTLTLEAGPTLLHTWFDDARHQPLCGAYYVEVTRQ